MTDTYPISDATRLKRHPERGSYDREVVHAILDEALVCHLAYAHGANVFAMPTVFARDGETLYVHGARANRSLDALAKGAPFSVTVTLIDGIVFARSAFHHSMNYRSVVLTGRIRELDDRTEKRAAMARLIDRLSAGRDATLRPMHDWELDTTRLLAIEIEHASAKVRSGGPLESIDDVTHPVWAGVVPLRLVASAPVPDEHVREASAPAIAECFSTANARGSMPSSA
jgi:hypothetical protein